jgi:DNA invertase Pin-like site-specific DNA recombinase
MQLIGFARVSTSNQDLANQLKMLEEHGCHKILHGKQSGSSKENESNLKELVDYVREGDTVVVTKLDRLGRSLKSILETIQQITDKNATLKTLDGAIDTTNCSPFAQAQLNLIGTFAQLERDLIVQRTTEDYRG